MILLAFVSLSFLISVMQFRCTSLMDNLDDLLKVTFSLVVASELMLFSFLPATILFKIPYSWIRIP